MYWNENYNHKICFRYATHILSSNIQHIKKHKIFKERKLLKTK